MLRLREEYLEEEGIRVTPAKTADSTGKSMLILWTPELRDAVAAVRAARPARSPWLFSTRRGEVYTSEGFHSIWQRFMARVLKETRVKERFTEHDLRAKTASDMETDVEASELLGHADPKITRRIYRRKTVKVSPLNRSELDK